MLKKLIQLLIGFICGYLFIKWFPIVFPFHFEEIILQFVLRPFEFFAAATVFIIGFMINAVIIKDGTEQIVLLVYRKQAKLLEALLSLFLLLSFLVLFLTGFWQTILFFCFSVLYGIISLDFRRLKILEE